MTSRSTRSVHGLCAACGRRCDAWLCVDCSINNDFFVVPRAEYGRLAGSTVARVQQLALERDVERDHFLAMQGHNQHWTEVVDGKIVYHSRGDHRITANRLEGFTAGEHRRWNEILEEMRPNYVGPFRLSAKRRAALERRRYQRFCDMWSILGLKVLTAAIAPEPPRKTRKKKISKEKLRSLNLFSERAGPVTLRGGDADEYLKDVFRGVNRA